jgi:hypothetical protein
MKPEDVEGLLCNQNFLNLFLAGHMVVHACNPNFGGRRIKSSR